MGIICVSDLLIIVTQSVLHHVHSLFQNEFLIEAIWCFLFQFRVPCLFLHVVQ
jgi:hypothetical protein